MTVPFAPSLGYFPQNSKQQCLYDIVQHYRTIPVIRKETVSVAAKEKKQVDVTQFDLENSPLDTYLYLHCLNYYTSNPKTYNKEMIALLKKHRILELAAKYSLNPLFIYFNYQTTLNREKEVEERYPQFAEFLVFKGNKLFTNASGQAGKGTRYVYMGPRQEKHVNGMDILSIKSTAGGNRLGFLVKVDGLVIFYADSHGCWKKDLWEAYTAEIDFLSNERTSNIDIAFLPIPGSVSAMTQEQREEFEKGIRYVVDKLRPKLVFPLVSRRDEYAGIKFAGEAAKKNINTKVRCPESRGDRFIYRK